MTLNKNQLILLNELQLDHSLTVPELYKRTKMLPHKIQYNLTKLREQQVIKPYLLINPHTLGLTDYCLFLNPLGNHPELLTKVYKILNDHTSVAFASRLVGEYLFTFSCFAYDIKAIDNLLASFRKSLPTVSWEMQFAIRLEWTLFQRAFYGTLSQVNTLIRSIDTTKYQLDNNDQKFLNSYAQNPNLPLARISNSAGLSEAAGRAHFKKLTQAGVIVGLPAYIDMQAVKKLAYRLVISVNSRSSDLDTRLREYGKKHHLIYEFVVCLGAWDYEFNIQIEDPAELAVCVSDLYVQFPGIIRKIQTLGDVELIKLHQIRLPT